MIEKLILFDLASSSTASFQVDYTPHGQEIRHC